MASASGLACGPGSSAGMLGGRPQGLRVEHPVPHPAPVQPRADRREVGRAGRELGTGLALARRAGGTGRSGAPGTARVPRSPPARRPARRCARGGLPPQGWARSGPGAAPASLPPAGGPRRGAGRWRGRRCWRRVDLQLVGLAVERDGARPDLRPAVRGEHHLVVDGDPQVAAHLGRQDVLPAHLRPEGSLPGRGEGAGGRKGEAAVPAGTFSFTPAATSVWDRLAGALAAVQLEQQPGLAPRAAGWPPADPGRRVGPGAACGWCA